MTIRFEKLKARLLANPKVKAEYDALAPEFEIAANCSGLACARASPRPSSQPDGHSQSTIARLENGHTLPSTKTLLRYAEANRQQVSGRAIGGLRCRRDTILIPSRHSEERSDEAIHLSFHRAMDCFASLAMTTSGPPQFPHYKSAESG